MPSSDFICVPSRHRNGRPWRKAIIQALGAM